MKMSRRAAMSLTLPAAYALAMRAHAADNEPDSRVVCVSKQINEFIYAIGAQGHLVARDLTSIYPPEILKLPSVGYHRALSAEGIISMRPSVFLTDGNVGPNAVLDQLREVGIPILVMDPGKSLVGAQDLLTQLGRYFHREETAAVALRAWKAGMDRALHDAEQWKEQPRPRVLIIHFGQEINNYLALASGGPAQQMLIWSGGENAIAKVGGMVRLTPERIAQAAPDVILATEVGFDRFGSAEKFAQLPGINLTPAENSGRIFRIAEDDVMYFGPRTPGAVAEIAPLIHR
jgi:iron complex transport system substrate-binding protein